MQVKVQVGDKGMPVRAQHLQAADRQGMLLVLGDDARQSARLLVGIEEAGQTVEGGPVLGKRIIRLAEERQRILHLAKGLGGLHDVAQLDRPAEEARCLQNEREHHCYLAHAQVETTEFQVPEHQRPGIHDQGTKAAQQGAPLDLRALVESDVLGVLAQAHQRVTEVGGELFVEEVQADQRSPEAEGDPGGDDDVQVHGKHHRSGNLHTGDGQRRRQPPKDAGERHQRNQRADRAQGEGHRVADKGVDVQFDTLIGVVHRLGKELATVVGIAVHPVVGQALGQPDPPLDAERLAYIEGEQRTQHMDGGQYREDAEQVPEGGLIKALQGAVEAVVPEREQHVQAHRE
ncbi:hypothetical protein D3C80_913160 [compost metagenome]